MFEIMILIFAAGHRTNIHIFKEWTPMTKINLRGSDLIKNEAYFFSTQNYKTRARLSVKYHQSFFQVCKKRRVTFNSHKMTIYYTNKHPSKYFFSIQQMKNL